ncbi:P-loop NTPase [candidate division KSB1 bacterium]|nr:P-loop NTPase [candidate division KSB1 bacterium]
MNDQRIDQNADQAMEDLQIAKALGKIKHKILVFSGKGGVGKSTVSANLAVALALGGKRVGLLDVDFHGPSIPKLMGMAGRRPDMRDDKIVPIPFSENLQVMSLGMLVDGADDAVIWRGPMKNGAIRQLVKDVAWGELDYLIVDSPPGTGDEPLSVAQIMQDLSGAIVVTQPQQLSVDDVRRSISFCEKLNLPVIGVIENMSGFICPHCGEVVDIFKTGGGEELATQKGIPFLGKLPIDPAIVEVSDAGQPFIYHSSSSPAVKAFEAIVERVVEQVEAAATKKESPAPSQAGEGAVLRCAMPLDGGVVSAHFGHARSFAFVDYDVKGQVAIKVEEKTPPPHEQGSIPRWIMEEKVNVLFTGGIGAMARQMLEEKGVKVVSGSPQVEPLAVVAKYVQGELETGENRCDH